MLSKSKLNLSQIQGELESLDLEVCFLLPTQTAMDKSIIDAISQVRSYFKKFYYHDYDLQSQGKENKVLKKGYFVDEDGLKETIISLYRPNTKRGDPRIWFTNIKEYVAPESLMALFIRDDKLYILNCSNSRLYQNFITNSRLLALVTDQTNQLSQAANELLNKMKAISSNGFIKTMRAGDTGVGFTLESLLGIQANSSKAPDFKGIEIKSIRKRNKKGTLLSMVPDWVNSNIKDANELVLKRGHINSSKGNLKTIFHSIDAVKPNSYNLQLKLDDLWIHQIHKLNNISEKDVRWSIQALAERLAAKHKETFWVDTETRLSNAGEEEFLYKAVIHTSKIDIHSIPELIEQGSINIDYLLWEKRKDWKTYVNKRGFDFLWKIKMKDRDLLFKSVNKFPLS